MNLNDLKKSISGMTDDELQNEILRLRQARRTPIHAATTTISSKKKKPKMTRSDISELLRSLSGEELEDLVGRMEEA